MKIQRLTLAGATDFKCHQGFNLHMGEQVSCFAGRTWGSAPTAQQEETAQKAGHTEPIESSLLDSVFVLSVNLTPRVTDWKILRCYSSIVVYQQIHFDTMVSSNPQATGPEA